MDVFYKLRVKYAPLPVPVDRKDISQVSRDLHVRFTSTYYIGTETVVVRQDSFVIQMQLISTKYRVIVLIDMLSI